MAFADHIVKQGVGIALKLEVSLDNFATIYARYADVGGLEAAVDWDPRIVSIGPIVRGLGEDHALRSGSVEIVLGNVDGACDWMVVPENTASIRARFRLYVGAYEPSHLNSTGPNATDDWKMLGEFVLNNRPVMTLNEVRFVLDDDVQGQLQVGAPPLPTFAEALSPDLSAAPPYALDVNRFLVGTVQLAWGGPGSLVSCRRAFWGVADGGTYSNNGAWIVCATSSPDAVTSNDITTVMIELYGYPGLRELPRTWRDAAGTELIIWTREKTAAATVVGDSSGRTYRTLWIAVDDANFYQWMRATVGFANPPTDFEYNVNATGQMANQNTIKAMHVYGHPFSARTNTGRKQLATDIISDLLTYYYPKSAIGIDAASRARVAATLNADPAPCAGGVGGWAESRKPKTYRQHISDICDSFDFDAFMKWDGAMGFSTPNFDLAATLSVATLVPLDETRIKDDFTVQHPAREQRHAPFNRIINRDNEDQVFKDFPLTQASMGRILPRRVSTLWRAGPLTTLGGLSIETIGHDAYGGIRKTIRPVCEFTTDVSALLLELGDLVPITFTGGGVRTWLVEAIHQVEEITFIPAMNVVRLKLVWMDDLRNKRSYILDDEDLLLVHSTDAPALTVQDGNDLVFDGSATVNFNALGVIPGDILVLQDATEAEDSFKRFRSILIVDVPGSNSLTVSPSDLDFGTGAGTANVRTWKIVRGHRTYPTAAGDPLNYPNGGWIYGRISAEFAGKYEYTDADPEIGFLTGHVMRRG